ncbi:MAG: HEPN domain-containing protein [Candidatus Bathyarchaeia archaeon]
MGESKVEALMRVSEANIARAERRFEDGEYDSAVFHASLAVESAANAMIIKLGGDEAKDHRAISGLAAVLRRVRPELLMEEKYARLIERGREIQREVVYTRYPLKLAGRWVTPMEYYTRDRARKVIDDAKLVVEGIKEYLKASF